MRKFRAGLQVVLAALIAGCATGAPQAPGVASETAPKPPQGAPSLGAGYLAKEARPSSLALLPPPPEAGSAAFARDEAASKAALARQGGARWALAARDAELKMPQAADTFACALGVKLSPQAAPHLITLLTRTLSDLGLSSGPAKARYMRPRPFMSNGAPTCTPSWEPVLRKDGSYPSGHSALGWGWGLILAEIAPERTDALVARGRAFGQSRVMCNVHWQSDVEEGRIVAAAVVARLHAEPQFRADLDAARAEVAALRASGAQPEGCAAEAAALAEG